MFKHFVRNTNYCIIVLLTTVESSKDLKQVASGRRGSLNSLQLVSAGFPPFVQLSTTSVVRCNPKSGKCVLKDKLLSWCTVACLCFIVQNWKKLVNIEIFEYFHSTQKKFYMWRATGTWCTLHQESVDGNDITMDISTIRECAIYLTLWSSQVIGDALGWGFVVRGMAPCYVQAVDPGSPAAAAGIKVRCMLHTWKRKLQPQTY